MLTSRTAVREGVVVPLAPSQACKPTFDPNRVQGVAALLGSLREAGAEQQAAALAERLPGAGLFELFHEQEDRQDRFRFGREADGSPAGPWEWEGLERRGRA